MGGKLLLALLFSVFIPPVYLKKNYFLETRILPKANLTWKGWPGEIVLILFWLLLQLTFPLLRLSNYDIIRQESVAETLCPIPFTPVQRVLGCYLPDSGKEM